MVCVTFVQQEDEPCKAIIKEESDYEDTEVSVKMDNSVDVETGSDNYRNKRQEFVQIESVLNKIHDVTKYFLTLAEKTVQNVIYLIRSVFNIRNDFLILE